MTGEQLMIVLGLEPGKELTDADRADLVARNRRLPQHKRLGGYLTWRTDFPRTASMKIKRDVLAEHIRTKADPADVVRLS
jgi:hypothetical protein